LVKDDLHPGGRRADRASVRSPLLMPTYAPAEARDDRARIDDNRRDLEVHLASFDARTKLTTGRNSMNTQVQRSAGMTSIAFAGTLPPVFRGSGGLRTSRARRHGARPSWAFGARSARYAAFVRHSKLQQ
jgi:hypothetical protein